MVRAGGISRSGGAAGEGPKRLYLAGDSALELIRYLRVWDSRMPEDERLLKNGKTVRRKMLRDAISSVAGLRELDDTAQRWLEHVSRPIHAFVGERSLNTTTNQLVTHVLSGKVQAGMFLDLGHGVCVSTPQFVFMQLADKERLVETLLLGMELCGHYSRWVEPVRGKRDPRAGEHEENRSCTFKLPTAMQARNLRAFLGRMKGRHGVVAAKAAARWGVNESASPMETATYLLLCLPYRQGGYGLSRPVLNPKLVVSNPDGTHTRYPDLYWAKRAIDVEYNSDSAHSGDWARYRDSVREVQLVVANVTVMPLTRKQLRKVDLFDAFARGLAKLLGERLRPRDKRWAKARAKLRMSLLAVDTPDPGTERRKAKSADNEIAELYGMDLSDADEADEDAGQ